MHGDSYQEALRKLGARAGVAPGPETLSDKVERYHLYLLENRIVSAKKSLRVHRAR